MILKYRNDMKQQITPLMGTDHDGTPFVIFDVYKILDTITIFNDNIYYNHFGKPTVVITSDISFNSEEEYFFKSLSWNFTIHFDLCIKLFVLGKSMLQEQIIKGYKHPIYIEY